MGSLFKQIYRYTRPRTFRHNESLWPYTQIERADTGEIARLRYKGRARWRLRTSARLKTAPKARIARQQGLQPSLSISANCRAQSRLWGSMAPWFLSGKVTFSLYVIVDMEFFDRRQDVIRSVIADPNILLFTTMHGIAKILDRHAADLRCRLALIEDACYKIYQPKVADALKWEMYKSVPGASFAKPAEDICFPVPIFATGYSTQHGSVLGVTNSLLSWV